MAMMGIVCSVCLFVSGHEGDGYGHGQGSDLSWRGGEEAGSCDRLSLPNGVQRGLQVSL